MFWNLWSCLDTFTPPASKSFRIFEIQLCFWKSLANIQIFFFFFLTKSEVCLKFFATQSDVWCCAAEHIPSRCAYNHNPLLFVQLSMAVFLNCKWLDCWSLERQGVYCDQVSMASHFSCCVDDSRNTQKQVGCESLHCAFRSHISEKAILKTEALLCKGLSFGRIAGIVNSCHDRLHSWVWCICVLVKWLMMSSLSVIHGSNP